MLLSEREDPATDLPIVETTFGFVWTIQRAEAGKWSIEHSTDVTLVKRPSEAITCCTRSTLSPSTKGGLLTAFSSCWIDIFGSPRKPIRWLWLQCSPVLDYRLSLAYSEIIEQLLAVQTPRSSLELRVEIRSSVSCHRYRSPRLRLQPSSRGITSFCGSGAAPYLKVRDVTTSLRPGLSSHVYLLPAPALSILTSSRSLGGSVVKKLVSFETTLFQVDLLSACTGRHRNMVSRGLNRMRGGSVKKKNLPNTIIPLPSPASPVTSVVHRLKTSAHRSSVGDLTPPSKLSGLDHILKLVHPRHSKRSKSTLKIAPSGAIVFTPTRSQESLGSSVLPGTTDLLHTLI